MLDIGPKVQPLSIDIETSTNTPEEGEILSVAAIPFYTGSVYYWEIRHDKLVVMPESMRVNGIDICALDSEDRVPIEKADKELSRILKRAASSYYDDKAVFYRPMGLSVGSFDMQFMRRLMPTSYKALGRRVIDTNTLIYASYVNSGDVRGLDELHEEAYDFAKQQVPGFGLHNPVFDCFLSCYTFAKLTNQWPEWMLKGGAA